MHDPQQPQRHLWQIFLTIRKQDFQQVLGILRDTGFAVEEFLFAAIARKSVTQQIVITAVPDTSYQWQNAVEMKKGNGTVLCASPAVILLDICKRIFRILTKPNPQPFSVCWMMDMRILLAKMQPEDWQQAAQLAAKEHVSSHIHMLLSLYCAVTGIEIAQKELFANARNASRLVRSLKTLHSLPEGRRKVRRLVINCRLRRPDSLWHTGRLCVKEVCWVLRNKFIQKN